jgi:hypothetical protein
MAGEPGCWERHLVAKGRRNCGPCLLLNIKGRRRSRRTFVDDHHLCEAARRRRLVLRAGKVRRPVACTLVVVAVGHFPKKADWNRELSGDFVTFSQTPLPSHA